MGSIKFFKINETKLQQEEYRKKYNINTQNLYPYLLIDISVLYSKKYLCITNEKAVFIYTVDEILSKLKTDSKFVNYLYLEDPKELYIKLDQLDTFDSSIVKTLFKNLSSAHIVPEPVDDEYMLNHYLKKSCKIELKQILEDTEASSEIDSKGYLFSLLETQLNLHVITLKYKSQTLLWSYFNIQEDAGFYYPILHIADYQHFVATKEIRYQRYFIPKEVLKAILTYSRPIELVAKDEDFIPTNRLCGTCKFNSLSQLHDIMCKVYEGWSIEGEEAEVCL